MAVWSITFPDGREYEVTADSEEQAHQLAVDQVTQETQQEYKNLPLGSKIFQTFDDAARNAATAMSLGGIERLAGAMPDSNFELEKFKTSQAAARSGLPGLLERLGGYAVLGSKLPSAVNPVTEAIGGPAAVRMLTSGTTAAAETAALGGGESALRGEDVASGIEAGALAGPLGLAAAKGIAATGPALRTGLDYTKSLLPKRTPSAPVPFKAPAEAAPPEAPVSPISAAAVEEAAVKNALPKVVKTAAPTAEQAAKLITSAEEAAAKAQRLTAKVADLKAKGAPQAKIDDAAARASKARDQAAKLKDRADKIAPTTESAVAMEEAPPAPPEPSAAPPKGPLATTDVEAGQALKRQLADAQTARYQYNKLGEQIDEALKRKAPARTIAALESQQKTLGQKADRLEAAYQAATAPPKAAAPPPKAPLKEALTESVKAAPPKPKGPLSGTFGENLAGGNVAPPKAPPKVKIGKTAKTPADLRAEAIQDIRGAIRDANLQAKSATGTTYDAAIGDQLKNLRSRDSFNKAMSPEELAAIDQVITGDPSTKAARVVGQLLSGTTVMGGMAGGGLISVLGQHPVLGATLASGIPAAGYLGRKVADAGARNLQNRMLSVVFGEEPKSRKVLTKDQRELYNALRLLGIDVGS